MNILLLGSGGRESALAWKISQSDLLSKLYIAPGNGGTHAYGENVNLDISDFIQIEAFCFKNDIDTLICGPEQPAVDGLWNYFQKENTKNIYVVAPSKGAAMLEGSKAFAKEFMAYKGIPTAKYLKIEKSNIEEGYKWTEENEPPFVIKADGLAAGKGVVLPETKEEARTLLNEFINDKKFGNASATVVLEEFLEGTEFSIFVYTDNYEYVLLPNAKDYKRRYEGDKGLNTGGMGCISPVPFVSSEMITTVSETIIKPTMDTLKEKNLHYTGFIYFGLINTANGPKVIEYNCRLGDPETEVILPRLESDLLEIISAGKQGALSTFETKISDSSCSTVILVSDGYPETYEKGKEITGIENVDDSIIFHAGTKIENTNLLTNGGRVIAVSSLGDSLKESLDRCYESADRIRYKGVKYRKDIGYEFL